MSLDDRTTQQKLTPEERRELLRAFADRMLLKVTAMDDPEDLPGVEKAVRTAAMIERIYSRCDRAERQRPEPRKLEAECAANEEAAIKAQVSLAGTLKWGEERRQSLGQWWEAAGNVAKSTVQEPIPAASHPQKPVALEHPAMVADPSVVPSWQKVTYVDYTEAFEAARAELALKRREARSTSIPPPGHPPPNSG
ncbi:hypothetical protein [Asticcacaulis taihuensis]|uniref:hypothetical protein n=1 Tax=Asticcacaulis taihuensis TaxID=260084 RepID=UPI0026F2EE20|nr:hypothetical protein [Asticcacaulis taihuensis]